MTSTVINGAVLEVTRTFPDDLFHCIVTSIPYYGLRKYGTDPVVWDGDLNCQHEWGDEVPGDSRGGSGTPTDKNNRGEGYARGSGKGNFCQKCGAWKGELGQEPTPELYVKHITDIFRELRRVLRKDGVCWLNVGDSYASKWPCGTHRNDGRNIMGNIGTAGGRDVRPPRMAQGAKEKDLIGIPWMLAFSLRADGWYLRSDIPWLKRNSMPSSVKDRPGSSIEHIFLLTKSAHYFYDHIATMQHSSESYNKDKRPREVIRQCVNPNGKYPDEGQFKKRDGVLVEPINTEMLKEAGVNFLPSGNGGAIIFDSPEETAEKVRKQDGAGNNTYTGFNDRYTPNETGLRYMRDSDFFFKTWQGLLHNEDGEPMALVVNPKGYKGAHFACFPVKLAEALILAGTSEKGVCPHCGAPWIRTTSRTPYVTRPTFGSDDQKQKINPGVSQGLERTDGHVAVDIETTGWAPSCSCPDNIPVPATVYDPFSGSCATGVACQWHNRDFVGTEINPDYCKLGRKRLEENK